LLQDDLGDERSKELFVAEMAPDQRISYSPEAAFSTLSATGVRRQFFVAVIMPINIDQLILLHKPKDS